MDVKKIALLAALSLLSACSGNGARKAESMAARGDWLKAVMEYRSELERNPNSIELKSSLRQAELRAAEYYFQQGVNELAGNDYEAAIGYYEQGLAAMPEHEKLQTSMHTALAKREAALMLKEAHRYKQIGSLESERAALERAMALAPGDRDVLRYWNDFNERLRLQAKDEFDLKTEEKVTLNFHDADIKEAFNFLSNVFGINVIFDEEVREKTITLYAKDISFRHALNLMMGATKTFYKRVSANTILLAPDTKDKRGQYEDYLIRTFHLTNASAKPMADILKGIISPQKVVVNEELNTLTVRDTEEVLRLAAKVVEANDRKPAEVILEVDILEVNKQKSQQLGFDYGSMVSLTYPNYPVSDSFSDTLAQGVVTLPGVSFRYFKQNVDAKTLANPKVRVVDGKQAKIHIGDRVPLRSSTIQDATGQTRTTFQYTDIGIRLTVEPQVQLDNATMVKLGLEVSSLGQDLGTTTEPAYSIGTRNAETYMLLRDGETALLGGLIRDEDRHTRVKVPGLGDIPVIGSLFSSYDDSTTQTDVLLTITPRVIRSWQLPPKDTWNLYSGKAERYFSQPLLSDEQTARQTDLYAGQYAAGKEVNGLSEAIVVSLDKAAYRVDEGGELEVKLIRSPFSRSGSFPLRLRFDESLMSFEGMDSARPELVNEVSLVGDGEIRATVDLDEVNDTDATTPIAVARFKTKATGVSYLIIGSSTATDASGERYRVKLDSSYVVIE